MKVGNHFRNRPIGKQKPEQIRTAEEGYYTPAGPWRCVSCSGASKL
jgi:hypothetical protein